MNKRLYSALSLVLVVPVGVAPAQTASDWKQGVLQNLVPQTAAVDEPDCPPAGGTEVAIATAKLYIEHNASDEDTGVHGAFDDHGWSRLCVWDPDGRLVLAVGPQGALGDLTLAGIFFESREPPNAEYSIEDLEQEFPQGRYAVRAASFDGSVLVGNATFSHAIPAAPEVLWPLEDAVVSTAALEVRWGTVTATLDGDPLAVTGYEVIITKEVEDDPNGFSRPTLDVHLPPDRTSLSIPAEFLEPETEYELEILALEVSGNQTISVSFFETE